MSMNSTPSWLYDTPENRVFVTFFHALAILFTILRLTRRTRIRLLSWDDAWAAITLVLLIAHLTTRWIEWRSVNDRRATMDEATYIKQVIRMVSIRTVLFTATIWASRISLALSVARILPPGRLRTTAIVLSVACFLTGSIFLTAKVALLNNPRPDEVAQFEAVKWLVVLQVAADVIASLLLLTLPLYTLWNTRSLPAPERRLLMVLSMGSFLTLGACCAQAAFVLRKDGKGWGYAGQLHVTIAVAVCNFLVVISTLFRLLFRLRRKTSSLASGSDSSIEGEEHNSGEHIIGLASTGLRPAQTRSCNSTSLVDDSSVFQLTELEGFQTQTYSLGSHIGSWDGTTASASLPEDNIMEFGSYDDEIEIVPQGTQGEEDEDPSDDGSNIKATLEPERPRIMPEDACSKRDVRAEW
ncbi:hypothetical protein V5O48_005039 [Marasmius crinis-equi]|uniref:Integral membrane protein n=1 Tax=Marasmius crinis-equi TaxID=585013 RepID=A0ABR3FND0_9AGAR